LTLHLGIWLGLGLTLGFELRIRFGIGEKRTVELSIYNRYKDRSWLCVGLCDWDGKVVMTAGVHSADARLIRQVLVSAPLVVNN